MVTCEAVCLCLDHVRLAVLTLESLFTPLPPVLVFAVTFLKLCTILEVAYAKPSIPIGSSVFSSLLKLRLAFKNVIGEL